MMLIVELDHNWTVGIDWYQHIKGIRLGYIAVHFLPYTLDELCD